MELLYNSDSFVVVRFDPPATPEVVADAPRRGGYEIVDKVARREIYIEGLVAERFQQGVQALAENNPSVEAFDDFIAGYCALAAQPVLLH